MEIFGDSDIGNICRFGYWRYLEIWILEIFGYLEIWILEIRRCAENMFFLIKYIHLCMLNTKHVHFPFEILIFWLIWEAKKAARARRHIPRQVPGRIACWEPKMLNLYWFLCYFRIRNEAAQPRAATIQFLNEPQGPHSASTVWGIFLV